MDQSDMQAMKIASGMAGIRPILAIALGIVSMICPICTQARRLSAVNHSWYSVSVELDAGNHSKKCWALLLCMPHCMDMLL